jgi:serine/threonine protein kinase
MTPERHQLICELLYQALELDSRARESFLNRVCSSDAALRQELDGLLSSSENVRANFLRSSVSRPTLESGTKLGDYEVESLVGSGGMGEVYRARDTRLNRYVAIKVLPADLVSDRKQLWRFEQEARAAAALNHPNILAVYQMGEHKNEPYMVTELLEGETLRVRVRRGPIAPREAAAIADQIGQGLAAAHEAGIVHRDLKPENLFVTKNGVVKILDFGLAKTVRLQRKENEPATEAGAVVGTLGYMSPEQARGFSADARSDIFAFGVVLYEMLTGGRAFERQTAADTLSAVLNEDPPPISRITPSVPRRLRRIVERCLKKSPEARFQHVTDVLHELEHDHGRPWLQVIAACAILALAVGLSLGGRKDLLQFAGTVSRSLFGSHKSKPVLVERKLTANLQDNPVVAAAISRDGKYVAYTDNAKNVRLLLADTGDSHPLALDSSFEPVDWFPDGVHLLLKHTHGDSGLWKFSTWDSRLQQLWSGPIGSTGSMPLRNEAVSPDGSHVAFIGGNDLREVWVMGAGGEEPHKIREFKAPDDIGNLSWSPSGTRLAYILVSGTFAKHDSAIETCDFKGSDCKVALSDPMLWGRDSFGGLAWLADGRIVYSRAANSPNLDEYNLWAINVDSDGRTVQGPEPLTDWKGFAAPGLQAVGRRLLVRKLHSEDVVNILELTSSPRKFQAMPLKTDSWRNWVKSWTVDSRNILLYSERNGRWTICQQSIEGGITEILIAGEENYRDPVPTASGRLLFNSFPSEGVERRVMSTPISGGPHSVLITGPQHYSYDCAYGGTQSCIVAELKENELVFSILDPEKGKGEEIARVPYTARDVAHWSLSLDGSRIAMVETGRESGEIRILNLKDRAVSSLQVQPWRWKYLTNVAWSSDSQGFFAVTSSDTSSALLAIDPSGKATVLHEIDPTHALLGKPVASPDGRYLAFTKVTYVSDLVMLENF